MFILKGVKVLCFDTLLQVLILKIVKGGCFELLLQVFILKGLEGWWEVEDVKEVKEVKEDKRAALRCERRAVGADWILTNTGENSMGVSTG